MSENKLSKFFKKAAETVEDLEERANESKSLANLNDLFEYLFNGDIDASTEEHSHYSITKVSEGGECEFIVDICDGHVISANYLDSDRIKIEQVMLLDIKKAVDKTLKDYVV